MRILFIKSNINSHCNGFDFGVASLSSTLKRHGHHTDFFALRQWSSIQALAHRIKTSHPDILAFGVYGPAFQSTVKASTHLRKSFPGILQVMGGVHFILNPEDLELAPDIDAVCTGEGERSFVDFIANLSQGGDAWLHTKGFWCRKNEEIHKNPPAAPVMDLEALPFPDRDGFCRQGLSPREEGKELILEYLFTRGCPYDCSYCSNHAVRKALGTADHVRRMSAQRAIRWIQEDLSRYACDKILIHDDCFALDRDWLREFLRLYQDIGIPFACNIRPGTADKGLLAELKNGGCERILIGVESGDEDLRSDVLNRKIKNETILETFRLAKALGLETSAFVLMGIPEETPATFLKTVRLLAEIQPDQRYLLIFYPYKGTDLYTAAKKKHCLSSHGWDFVERADTPLDMPRFPRKDILYYYHHFDRLTESLLPGGSLLSALHRKLVFALLALPPSSKWFSAAQALLAADEIACSAVRSIRDA